MKRLFISAILVSLCLACSSCNTKSPVNTTESSESEPTDASTYTETAKTADSAEATSESISEQITEPTTTLSSEPSITTAESEAAATTQESITESETVPSEETTEPNFPITMAGAVDKPPVYELLQNEAGNYTGVRFTYADGDTYTWECPVESILPPIVIFDFNYAYTNGVREKEIVLNEICLIEYATAEEGLFDRVNWKSREVSYRHQNEEGKKYTYGTGGCCHESGQIRFDEQGNLIYWGVDSPYDTYFKTRTGKVREVRPLKPGGSVPEIPEFTEWVSGVPESWWEEDGRFYGILNVTDYPTGLRMSGYDVLYYSEEPIEVFTKEMARDFFPDMVKQEYCAKIDGSSDVLCEIREFTHGFTFFYAIWGEFPPLANDPISEETILNYIRVDIEQISPHYFSKIITYNYDDHAVYSSTMGVAATTIYY
mgnify:FL=1